MLPKPHETPCNIHIGLFTLMVHYTTCKLYLQLLYCRYPLVQKHACTNSSSLHSTCMNALLPFVLCVRSSTLSRLPSTHPPPSKANTMDKWHASASRRYLRNYRWTMPIARMLMMRSVSWLSPKFDRIIFFILVRL